MKFRRGFSSDSLLMRGNCVLSSRAYLCGGNSGHRDEPSIACEWGRDGRLAGGRAGPYDELSKSEAVAHSAMQGLKIKPVEMPKWRSRTAFGVRAAGDDDKKRGDRGSPGT